MLSKNKARYITSLHRKKERDSAGLFLIEGDKVVKEFLQSGREVLILAAKPEWLGSLPSGLKERCHEIISVSYEELKSVSTLKSPHNAMAVAPYFDNKELPMPDPGKLYALLENIQDPGNLGTIIRAAAWFGIDEIICSENSVDLYNPKVIQATMGAFMKVRVSYTDLAAYLSSSSDIDIYSTTLDGTSVYDLPLTPGGLVLFGNESRGISPELQHFVKTGLLIPGAATESVPGIESLNVSMAASVIFSEFARRKRIS